MQKVGAKGTLLTQLLARPFQISSPNKGETEVEEGEGAAGNDTRCVRVFEG